MWPIPGVTHSIQGGKTSALNSEAATPREVMTSMRMAVIPGRLHLGLPRLVGDPQRDVRNDAEGGLWIDAPNEVGCVDAPVRQPERDG